MPHASFFQISSFQVGRVPVHRLSRSQTTYCSHKVVFYCQAYMKLLLVVLFLRILGSLGHYTPLDANSLSLYACRIQTPSIYHTCWVAFLCKVFPSKSHKVLRYGASSGLSWAAMSASQNKVCLDYLEAKYVKHLVKDDRFRIDLYWTQRDRSGSGLDPAATVGCLRLVAT